MALQDRFEIRPVTRRVMVAAVLLTACGVSAACGSNVVATPSVTVAPPISSSSTVAKSPSASAASGSASPASGVEAEVRAQYAAFWKALPQASMMSEDQAHSTLTEFLVNPALAKVEGTLAAQRAFHKQLYGEPTLRVTAVEVAGATATVTDCQKSDTAGVEDAQTGEKLTVGPARNPVRVGMTKTDQGVWKIATVDYLGGTC